MQKKIKDPLFVIKNIKSVLKYFSLAKVNYYLLAIPIGLSFLVAFLEGFSIGLLIPLLKGVIESDVAFLKDTQYVGWIFKWIWQNTPHPNIVSFSFVLFTVFFASISKCIFGYLSGHTLDKVIFKFLCDFRQLIFNRYLAFGKLYFDNSSVGYLNTVLMVFTNKITNFLTKIQSAITSLFIILFYLTIMFSISWKITLGTFLLIPLLALSVDWLTRKISKISQLEAESEVKLHSRIHNILTTMPLVKAFSTENMESEHFSYLNKTLTEIRLSMSKKGRLFGPLQEMVILSGVMVVVIVMAIYFHQNGTSNIAGAMVFFVVLRRMLGQFNSLNSIKVSLARVTGQIEGIESIFNDEGKAFIYSGESQFTHFNDAIEVRNLKYSYETEREILKDISFRVNKGETVALVGKTGSGKTSIAHLIMRFYDCDEGKIFIDGKDIREYDTKSLHNKIALISQEVYVFDETIRYNLTYGLNREIPEDEINQVIERCQLREFIKDLSLGIETVIGERGMKLSGGEKQRLSIARTMLREPEIIVLDEATSALDSRTERLVQGAIDEAIKGRTAIIIAHRLSTIKNANKVIVIDNGKIVEEGKFQDLINNKKYFYEYWNQQRFEKDHSND